MSKTYNILTRKIVLPSSPKVTPEKAKEIINTRNNNGFQKNIVVKYVNDKYILEDGWEELLWAYHKNIQAIPSKIENIDEIEKKIPTKLRKLKNEKLNPITEAEYIYEIIEFKGYDQKKLCEMTSKTQGAISNKLRLLKLPYEAIEHVENGKISERHARSLLKYNENEKALLEALNVIISEKMNVAQAEKYIKNDLQVPTIKKVEKLEKFKNLDLDGKIVISTIKNSINEVKTTIDKYGYTKEMIVEEVAANDTDEHDYTVIIKIKEKN